MKTLTNIQHFQLFCLENYKAISNKTGIEALNDFKQTNVFDYLESGYDVLHTQGKEYILADIKEYLDYRINPE